MMKTRLLLSLLILLAVALLSAPSSAFAAATLTVDVDHGVPLTLSGPASSVFIANPDIADVQVMSPTSIMIFGKRTGETTFMASDSAGNTLAERTVVVMQDLSDFRKELDIAIPDNEIKAQALPNGLVLTGEARDPAAVADAYKLAQRYLPASGGDIINRIKVVGSNQIHIRVRFAEVSRSVDNSLGFDWQNLGSIGGFALGISSGVPLAATGASILSNGNRPSNTSLGLNNDIVGISRTGQHFNVNGLIDALAQDGLVTILAEPNLTAMSGETASFLAGGEFPIPIPQGNGTVTIEFKKYGISLEFTPTLISENRINLHVKPEVSKISSTGNVTIANNVVPSLTVRKAETTIEVASGQSFAIAGLLDNDQTQTVNKYPILGDLPVLGALFRSDRFQNGQSELVIIITPYIVKPNGDQQLALPMDGFSPPTETERLLGLRYSNQDPNARPMSGPPIAAPAVPATVPVEDTSSLDTFDAKVSASMPAPAAAPITPVAMPTTMPLAPPMAALPAAPPINLSPTRVAPKPLRGPSSDGSAAPDGPGGFIME